MSVQRELPRRRRAGADLDLDFDAEQEVDVRRFWTAIAARWWVPLAGLALGLALGYVLAVGGKQIYRAEATIYLGQPFTAGGGTQIQSLATNPSTVSEIVHSESAIRAASRASGIPVRRLRGRISSQAVSGVNARRAPGANPLVEISVQGSAPARVQRAANALAERVTNVVSRYVNSKIATLKERIARGESEQDRIDRRLLEAQRLQRTVVGDRSLPSAERLILITSANATLNFLEQRQATIAANLFGARDALALAELVEQSYVVEPAVAVKTAARSARTSLIAGAILGLLLGIVAALVWEPLARRRGTAL